MIYDKDLEKNGKLIKKVSLLFINGDKAICDCCDEKKVTAHINTLGNDVMCICKDCLGLIVDEFDD